MKIRDITYRDEFYAEFILEGDFREANLLRKYLMGRVPVYAIDSILVRKNTTAYPIEYIAHRLGMLPVRIVSRNPSPEYRGYLNHSATKSILELTHKDILFESSEVSIAEYYPNGTKIRRGYEIIDLLPGQEIDVELIIRPGIGFKHAKFQTAIASYEQIDSNTYKMFVETLYHYSARELLERALEYMRKDVEIFKTFL